MLHGPGCALMTVAHIMGTWYSSAVDNLHIYCYWQANLVLWAILQVWIWSELSASLGKLLVPWTYPELILTHHIVLISVLLLWLITPRALPWPPIAVYTYRSSTSQWITLTQALVWYMSSESPWWMVQGMDQQVLLSLGSSVDVSQIVCLVSS